jgi:hypothetical protein
MGSSASKPGISLQLAQTAPKPTNYVAILGAILAIGVVFTFVVVASKYVGPSGKTALASDIAPTEVDGKVGSTVASTVSGSNTSLQFWMYIKDWSYKYGETKPVIAQTSSTNPGTSVPAVTLHPTDNSLQIAISLYPSGTDLNSVNTGSGTQQIVTVENVPLQSWFAVSITVYGRQVDVYINGRLQQSHTLDGVPMPASGKIIIGGGGGFGGAVCTVHSASNKIDSSDAGAFYGAGTACSGSTPAASTSSLSNLSLFGYTFVFGVKDSAGKDVGGLSSSDVSGWFSSSK